MTPQTNLHRYILVVQYISIYITPPLWRYLVKISTRKLWHTSSFSLERTDFKNVIFEKIPFWGRRGRWGQTTSKLKITKILNKKPIKTKWNPKFGLRDLENGLLTSRISEGAQWIFSKNTFFKSGQSTEKNEL